MIRYKCLIVEDEPLAAEILQDYIKEVPFLELIATCPDALFANDVLQNTKVDLMFLDINLPKLKAFDFINSLSNPPAIILTTAYHEYALKGYEYNVIDYLLKPIEFNRFLTAVNKFAIPINTTDDKSGKKNDDRPFEFFNVSKKMVRIYLDEILYIESLKEYVRIVAKDKSIVTKSQLGQIEEKLNTEDFVRIHRSFIVAKDKIDAFTTTEVEINGKHIPIGRSYKDIIQVFTTGKLT